MILQGVNKLIFKQHYLQHVKYRKRSLIIVNYLKVFVSSNGS